MTEQKNIYNTQEEEEQSSFSFHTIYTALILNWKWFVLSIIICVGCAYIYLRYATPTYNVISKVLIKGDENGSSRRSAILSSELGTVNSSYGVDNEQEILRSSTIAAQAVRDLKLYANYYIDGRIKDRLMYKTQPISVDIDPVNLEKMNTGISLSITRNGDSYQVKGTYYVPVDERSSEGPYEINKTIKNFPATIHTKAGALIFTANGNRKLQDGKTMFVYLNSPRNTAFKYVGGLTVETSGKASSVINLSFKDQEISRGLDYLKQLVICYNRQANEDKNEVAFRTEEFINERIEKIGAELNKTDGALEEYKRQNNLMELKIDARETATNASTFEARLADANTQIALINSLIQFANRPGNEHQVLPSNVGLQDETSTALINEFNKIALERNRLLRTASENNPTVVQMTSQLDDMNKSIHEALLQAKRNIEIQRNAIATQLHQYESESAKTPEQERILTQIGRQQEVTAGLYLMMLQKREENSISLAATADKGKVIELPVFAGKVSPNNKMFYLIALLIGIAIPSLILFLIEFFRFRIEGHEDVSKLTKLPIIADVAVANDAIKTRGDIVVHENKNNQMEEIFRGMRTNLQFMLKEGEKVVMFTSSTSGEGKTFNAANLAVSFALLEKKVVLVGLDIRKPRLAELFEINNYSNGITPLLTHENPTWEDIQEQIMPSEVNKNLDLLLAGPVPPNPAELMARPSLDIIFEHLKEHYDYIFIDTAPVGLVTDTLQIGRVANVTIYMCRADYTPKASFSSINAFATEKKLPNMALVINGIDMSRKKYGYQYGYGRYGRYGRYAQYGRYSRYSSYSAYGAYGGYNYSRYGNKKDNSIKL